MKFLKDMDVFQPHGRGIFYDMADADYRKVKAVSSSALKKTYKTLAHFKHFIEHNNEHTTEALRIGRLCHLAILEPAKFKDTVFYSEGDHKGRKPYIDDKKNNPGKEVLTIQEVELLTGLINGLSENKFIMELLAGGNKEVVIFTQDPDTGLCLKAKLDFLKELAVGAYVMDYKTAEDADPYRFEYAAFKYKYYLQIAYYTYCAQLEKVPVVANAFIAQEKDEPYLASASFYPQDVIDSIIADVIKPRLKMISDSVDSGHFEGYPPMAIPLSLLNTERI